MPFVFIVVGIGLLVVAIRGTQATAFQLLQSEFSGQNSFIKWALAIFILGAVGYIPRIRPVTRGLLILVLLVIFLKNGKGLFASFNSQIANPTASSAPSTASGGTGTGAGLSPLPSLQPLPGLNNNATPQAGNTQSFIGDLFGGNGVGSGAGGNFIDVSTSG